ncbi:MAG: hypothetical protein ACKOK8_17340, partial [Planctomycetia bacterium]
MRPAEAVVPLAIQLGRADDMRAEIVVRVAPEEEGDGSEPPDATPSPRVDAVDCLVVSPAGSIVAAAARAHERAAELRSLAVAIFFERDTHRDLGPHVVGPPQLDRQR